MPCNVWTCTSIVHKLWIVPPHGHNSNIRLPNHAATPRVEGRTTAPPSRSDPRGLPARTPRAEWSRRATVWVGVLGPGDHSQRRISQKHTCVYIYIYTYMCMYIYIHACLFVCLSVHLCSFACMCMCLCMCMCMCMCIYIYRKILAGTDLGRSTVRLRNRFCHF